MQPTWRCEWSAFVRAQANNVQKSAISNADPLFNGLIQRAATTTTQSDSTATAATVAACRTETEHRTPNSENVRKMLLKRTTVLVTLVSFIVAPLIDAMPILKSPGTYVNDHYVNDTNEIDDDWLLDDFAIDLANHFPRIYGVPNEEVGRTITREASLRSEPLTHPEQMGTYLEGDMLVVKRQRTILSHASHWAGGVVPYEFASNVDEESIERIMEAFATFERHTCIRFQPHAGEPDYIEIASNPEGCFASLGKVPGRSTVNLQKECTTRLGTMLHELMHTLGFVHEQNRWDRNKYVKVLFRNIDPEKMEDFREYADTELNGLNIEYDYNSVMHYSWDAFSKNGQPTITSRDPDFKTSDLGQRYYFSTLDIKKLNMIYNCPQASTAEPANQVSSEDMNKEQRAKSNTKDTNKEQRAESNPEDTNKEQRAKSNPENLANGAMEHLRSKGNATATVTLVHPKDNTARPTPQANATASASLP